MREIELKLQVPAAQRAVVDAAVAGRTPARRVRLQAQYFDTPQRALAAAGLALRVRREGLRWVQTLKGAAGDGMTRLEHNVALAGVGSQMPPVDPARHAGTPQGRQLLDCLAAHPGAPLVALYRTDIQRRSRIVRTGRGSVELAFDQGHIVAGERRIAVCELEIELVAGAPRAVIDTARRWVARHGLWLDTRTKAERGELLWRGQTMAEPRGAAAVELGKSMTPLQATRAVLRSCADQIGANASQIATGDHADEHVHQLRVGLRRLRSALALFEPVADHSTLRDAAAALFQRLGTARDRAVLDGDIAAELNAACTRAGVPDGMPFLLHAASEEAPTGVLRERATQDMLLDLLDAGSESAERVESPGDTALRDLLARRLKRWYRSAAAEVGHFAELDDAGRHALRKRIKRLRYAVEFSHALFGQRAVRRFLRPLRTLQERLGALADVVLAADALQQTQGADARHWFARGWLAARREALMSAAEPELKAFVRAERFWRRG